MTLRLPIRAQLLLIGLVVGLPAMGLFAWHSWESSVRAKGEAYSRVSILAQNSAGQLDTFLADSEALLARAAERPLVRALDPKRCDPAILEFAGLHPEFVSLGMRDTSGRVICTSNPKPVRIERPGQARWFDEGLQTPGMSAGDAFVSPLGRWISILTYPIRRDDGRVAGLLGLPVDLVKYAGRLFRAVPGDAVVMVTDRQNRVLMRSVDGEAWIGKVLPGSFVRAARESEGRVFDAEGPGGTPRLWAVATVSRAGWLVMAGMPEAGVLAEYRNERNNLVAFGVVMLAAVLVIAWWSGAAIISPVIALGRTASRVAAGETGARASVNGPRELEQVAREFNRMLDVRDNLREERAALVGHFGQLARLAREVILLIDPDGWIVEANEAAVAAYGWSIEELHGMHIRDLRAEEAKPDLGRHWSESARPGGTLFETLHRRRDGSTFPVEVSASVIDIEGRPWRQSFIRDISERRAAQEQLRRLTVAYATLSETNQAIVRSVDEAGMLQRVCTIAVEFGGYLGAWVGLVDARTGEIVPAAVHGPIADYAKRLRLSVDPTKPEGQGPAGLAARSGMPRYCDDFLDDPATGPWHEMAREFGIRAHVVLPLRRGGAVAGVLTLCSTQPGIFDAQTRSLLEEMAIDVSFALDNFDRKAALAEWAERYEATVKASGQILLDRNLATGGLKLGGDVFRILGYREEDLSGTHGRWTAIVHGEDRAAFAAELDRVAREGRPFHLQYRVVRKDGTVLVVQDDGYLVRDAAGKPVRMVGFVADITERKIAEDRIRSQLEELRRWHSAMLGREVRVLQLKREVNDVLAEAGRPPRYASARTEREETSDV